MDRKDAERELDELRRELERHNRLYYVHDAPEIGDFEYDQNPRHHGQWHRLCAANPYRR